MEFGSFDGQKLSASRIEELAAQYDDVDMAQLMGADANNFPFLITAPGAAPAIMIWNKPRGMVAYEDGDPVRRHAIIAYLREQAYPEFASRDEAEAFAEAREWPLEEL